MLYSPSPLRVRGGCARLRHVNSVAVGLLAWCGVNSTPATKPGLLPLPCERGPVVEQPRGGSHRARVPRQSSSRGPAVVVVAARWVCAPAPRQFSSRGPVGVVWCERTPATKPGLLPLPCERGPVVEQPRGGSHRARVPRQSSGRGPAVVVVAAGWVCARRARHGAHGVDKRSGALLESVANAPLAGAARASSGFRAARA